MAMRMGTCKFCGQTAMVDVNGDQEFSQEQLDVLVSEQCRCDGSRRMKEKKRILEATEYEIGTMLGEEFAEVAQFLIEGLDLVYEEQIKKLTVALPGQLKVNLYKVGPGIKLESQKVQKLESLTC